MPFGTLDAQHLGTRILDPEVRVDVRNPAPFCGPGVPQRAAAARWNTRSRAILAVETLRHLDDALQFARVSAMGTGGAGPAQATACGRSEARAPARAPSGRGVQSRGARTRKLAGTSDALVPPVVLANQPYRSCAHVLAKAEAILEGALLISRGGNDRRAHLHDADAAFVRDLSRACLPRYYARGQHGGGMPDWVTNKWEGVVVREHPLSGRRIFVVQPTPLGGECEYDRGRCASRCAALRPWPCRQPLCIPCACVGATVHVRVWYDRECADWCDFSHARALTLARLAHCVVSALSKMPMLGGRAFDHVAAIAELERQRSPLSERYVPQGTGDTRPLAAKVYRAYAAFSSAGDGRSNHAVRAADSAVRKAASNTRNFLAAIGCEQAGD